MKRVRVFKAMHNAECRAWDLEKEPIQKFLAEQTDAHIRTQSGWHIVEEDEDAFEVAGVVQNWNDSGEGEPEYHVHWTCPVCNHEAVTDIDDQDSSPQLWRCGQPRCPAEHYTIVRWS